ncbi:MAG TPA: hypothetical protein VGO24_07260 [Solirubrobacterales bacterium]|jgi:hypothetical protein|nr:hypothetical protein [Solirubrobacterales bacterium]
MRGKPLPRFSSYARAGSGSGSEWRSRGGQPSDRGRYQLRSPSSFIAGIFAKQPA